MLYIRSVFWHLQDLPHASMPEFYVFQTQMHQTMTMPVCVATHKSQDFVTFILTLSARITRGLWKNLWHWFVCDKILTGWNLFNYWTIMLLVHFFTFCAFLTIGILVRFAQGTKEEIMFGFKCNASWEFSWINCKIFQYHWFHACYQKGIIIVAMQQTVVIFLFFRWLSKIPSKDFIVYIAQNWHNLIFIFLLSNWCTSWLRYGQEHYQNWYCCRKDAPCLASVCTFWLILTHIAPYNRF